MKRDNVTTWTPFIENSDIFFAPYRGIKPNIGERIELEYTYNNIGRLSFKFFEVVRVNKEHYILIVKEVQ